MQKLLLVFLWDGMPGKQMSIDADLHSSIIDAEEAKRRGAVLSNVKASCMDLLMV
ncbi:FHIPEP family type III secretion protein [Arsenophonus endosymbiont of Aleurodicus floccissimus]|uniref:FHIPEP family type III secretion protein n=1 Tax=Arsenophonus endosymbiont of Aleurodicus floccissimus TaxID=2152761 RepID=UPI002729940F|nr:FHIPEP family type III secretion protein [Arsenophonus endosymbiont of Aleurodicus floccissimus]